MRCRKFTAVILSKAKDLLCSVLIRRKSRFLAEFILRLFHLAQDKPFTSFRAVRNWRANGLGMTGGGRAQDDRGCGRVATSSG
jgi:hypothetical protein